MQAQFHANMNTKIALVLLIFVNTTSAASLQPPGYSWVLFRAMEIPKGRKSKEKWPSNLQKRHMQRISYVKH